MYNKTGLTGGCYLSQGMHRYRCTLATTVITGMKKKRHIHLAFQQNKQLGVQTVVIVISAVVVFERSSLIWHNTTYMQSPRPPEHSTF